MEDLNTLITDDPLAASTMEPVYNQPRQDDSQPWHFPSHDYPAARGFRGSNRGYPFTHGIAADIAQDQPQKLTPKIKLSIPN